MLKRLLLLALSALIFNPESVNAAITIDVLTDAYIEDFERSGTLDGNPDEIWNTNAVIPGKGVLSSGIAIDARGILVFDIDAYSGQTLFSALLSVYAAGVDHNRAPESIDGTFYIYEGDGVITLNDFDRPATFIGTQTFAGSPTLSPYPLQRYDIPITAQLQSLLDQNAAYAEFRIETDELSIYINAGDVAPPYTLDTSFPGPRLLLDFQTSRALVPEPATLALLGLGSIGLLRRRRPPGA